MMAPLLSTLSAAQRKQFLADLNYLNTSEIKSICKKHGIPYTIAMETADGRRRSTSEHDRKGVMLKRLKRFLETGVILEETRFPAVVVCHDPPAKQLTASDLLFYGQYDKTNRSMMNLLKDLTGGEFKNGAIARILAREFWTAGTAPTFEAYAAAWRKARKEHTQPNPEWAFLSDRAAKADTTDWKKLRRQKAARVMKTLEKISKRKN
jgi:hypothetical protein